MKNIKQSPNFKGAGGVTKKNGVDTRDNNKIQKSSFWKEFQEGQTFRVKLVKIALAFIVAKLVLWGANIIWFRNHSFSVNADLDFAVKTICVFIAAAIILMVADAIMKTSGRATKLAFGLFLFVTVAGHYYPSPYYEDGKPTVYVNSRTGDIYSDAYADIQHDAKTNRNYFLHPRSNDTCWNDSPKNVELIDLLFKHRSHSGPNSSYNPPMAIITYPISDSAYTFVLKAGQTLDPWVTFQQDRKVNISLSSDNYDYIIVYSEAEQYHDGLNVAIPKHDPTKFFLKAGDTDQIITMKLSK
jgi:hypothetical protein